MQDGTAAPGIHLDMYQTNCNLRMDDVRHARYRLLIEACRQFDPAKLAMVSARRNPNVRCVTRVQVQTMPDLSWHEQGRASSPLLLPRHCSRAEKAASRLPDPEEGSCAGHSSSTMTAWSIPTVAVCLHLCQTNYGRDSKAT